MENSVIRVTKAQKLEVIKAMIPADASHTFPGDEKKAGYVFNFDEVMNFLDKEISQLAKKNSGDRAQTDTQKENEDHKSRIISYLERMEVSEDHPGATCSEMFKAIPEFAPYSPQKVSALCRQLKLAGKITSEEKKGKTYFTLL